MKFDQLKEYDSSLTYVSGNRHSDQWPFEIQGISAIYDLRPYHLVFIKDKDFLLLLLEALKSFKESKTLIVIIEKNFFNNVSCRKSELMDDLISSIGYLATVDNVELAISYLSKPFYKTLNSTVDEFSDGRHIQTALIDSSAKIGPNVFIGDRVKIGKNVTIFSGCSILALSEVDDDTVIFPNVTVYKRVHIGRNCRIHANVVIGADGFGYNFHNGIHHKVWHIGGVRIEDDVEIGASTTIDAGTFSPTVIGKGTKIDNQVQIAHNCRTGKGVIFCGQSALAGSCEIGEFTVLGGRAGVGPNIALGDRCQVGGGGMVNRDWPSDSAITGYPARPVKEWLKGLAYVRKESLR